MAFNYVSGHQTGVTFQATGSNLVPLGVEGHTWDEEVIRHLVTSTLHGGVQARIGGPLDGKGTVKCSLDLTAGLVPWLTPPAIRAGVTGIIHFYFGVFQAGSGHFQIPIIIGAVHYAAEVQGKVTWAFDCEMNSNVGSYVYPS